jgi:hypothetical protein
MLALDRLVRIPVVDEGIDRDGSLDPAVIDGRANGEITAAAAAGDHQRPGHHAFEQVDRGPRIGVLRCGIEDLLRRIGRGVLSPTLAESKRSEATPSRASPRAISTIARPQPD